MLNDSAPYQEWTLNAGENVFEATGPDNNVYQATMEELTGGKYGISGNSVRDNSTGRFIGSVNRTRTSSLIVTNDGRYLLVNSTDATGITNYGRTQLVTAASLETEFTAPDGTITQIEVPYANLNRIGKQLIVNDIQSENPIYRWSDIGTENLPPGFRPATNQETIEYGLSSALIRQYRSLVTSIADAGIEDENGNPIETITDAATYLVRSLQTNAEYARIFELT